MCSKPKWSLLASACLLIGCSSEADRTGSGRGPGATVPTGSGGTSATGQSNAAAGSGGDNFGNAQNPTAPPPAAPINPIKPDECAAVSQEAQNRLQPADIIIGIDTSGSMDEEAAFVQENMNAFSQQIIASGVDVRVILVADPQPTMMAGGGLFGGGGDDDDFGVCIGPPLGSGMCPADSNPPIYTHVNQKVDSNDVLGVLIGAYQSYKAQLRPDSVKHFVSVTDDDATDPPINTPQGFIDAVKALEPMMPEMWSNWHYSSIYCFTACEQAAEIGAVHRDLVMQTTGVGGDLCLQDFKPVFDALAAQVVEGVMLACDWEIPAAPGVQTFDKMKTNVRLNLDGTAAMLGKTPRVEDCGDLEAWYYDNEDAPKRVHACPATCTKIQAAKAATVDILFGCTTEKVR
jgi:hypothetical protein